MCERNSEEGIFSLLHLTCHTSDFMPTLVCRAGANYYMAREMVQSFHGHREFIVMWVLKQYNLICILGLKQSQFGIQNSLTARWCGPKSKPSKMESGGGSSVQTEILSPSEAGFFKTCQEAGNSLLSYHLKSPGECKWKRNKQKQDSPIYIYFKRYSSTGLI